VNEYAFARPNPSDISVLLLVGANRNAAKMCCYRYQRFCNVRRGYFESPPDILTAPEANVTAIAASRTLSAAATGNRIVLWGRRMRSCPGYMAHRLPAVADIMDIAVSSAQVLMLLNNGSLVVMSCGDRIDPLSRVPDVVASSPVKAIALCESGDFALALLADSGQVIGWGPASLSTPETTQANVVSIACGYQHALATVEGKTGQFLVAWGMRNGENLFSIPDGLDQQSSSGLAIAGIVAASTYSLALLQAPSQPGVHKLDSQFDCHSRVLRSVNASQPTNAVPT
jgi:hypothetical protein